MTRVLGVGTAVAILSCCTTAVAATSGPLVYVYPSPGSRVAPPASQIVFRGLPPDQIGPISVVGSRSGAHRGRVRDDSDGRGGSFVPARAFTAGETVTVRTRLRIAGGRRGAFRFTVATPLTVSSARRETATRPPMSRVVQHFRSVPTLAPEPIRVLTRTAAATPEDIFLAPQAGPAQRGPMIVGPDGSLVWFKPAPPGEWVHDFEVQSYRGRPVLTWWQGHTVVQGYGYGEGVIDDAAYQPVTVVHAADGLSADLHEFQLTPQGSALITAYYPVYWTTAGGKHPRRTVVLDGVVQEIDIATGLLLFEWHSLDHIGLGESYDRPPDYFHINSIEQTPDGQLLISARNTWAGYLVGHGLGRVLWRLGGKRSSFRMGAGAGFAYQHDIRLDRFGRVTLYDDGAGASPAHRESRGLTLALDTRRMTARLVVADRHRPPLLAYYEGSDQLLGNGHSFVGWGQKPFFTEFDAQGHIVFDARFAANLADYRAFLEPWSGQPTGSPAVAAAASPTGTVVYASWNGTTSTSAWRILVGAAPSSLTPIMTAPKQGFETTIALGGSYAYAAVQALDAAGDVLGTSAVVQPH